MLNLALPSVSVATFAAPQPWLYMAHQVADKSVRNGWMVKRYYDEWT